MRRYAETFFRLWFIVLVPIIVLPLVAFQLVRSTRGSVIVTANIWVTQASVPLLSYADPNLPPAQNTAIGLGQLLQSRSFDLLVAKESPAYWQTFAGRPNPDELVVGDLGKYVQTAQAGPNLVALSFTTKNGRAGMQVVRSILNEAPHEMQRLNQQQASSSIAYYTGQLNGARSRLVRSSGNLGFYMKIHHIRPAGMLVQSLFDPRFATLYQTTQAAQVDVQSAEQRLSQSSAQGAAQPKFQVIDPPTMIPVPTTKKTLALDLGIAVFVGLLLGGAVIVGKTALDHSVRYVDEVPELFNLPVLATVPYAAESVRKRRGRLTSGEPESELPDRHVGP